MDPCKSGWRIKSRLLGPGFSGFGGGDWHNRGQAWEGAPGACSTTLSPTWRIYFWESLERTSPSSQHPRLRCEAPPSSRQPMTRPELSTSTPCSHSLERPVTQLYSMRNESDLSPSALAHFVRGELATSLRSRKPYNVNLLMGGVDPITGKPSLYWLDYLASLAEVPYAAHGYAQYYCLSILDKHHHPDITLHQGIKILTMCIDELKRRLPIDFKGMVVKAVKADGIVDIEFDDDKVVKCA
uniref:WGS project CBME000000000 data, contig CS3487_c001600 n=1 Tax=Fusarium pseudograminearum CS3487 TaxID=1318458 RepID=A0A096PEF3_FUSPS|nr:unnamed protein product [Fusarium pseudograminearum CS3487]